MTTDASDLEARVAAAAAECFGGCRSIEMWPLEGGHSGLTWIAELACDPPRRLVVKSTPPGRRPHGRHDVLRQAKVLRALSDHAEVRVPRVYFSDAAAPQFFAMQLVEGLGAEPVLAESDPVLDAQQIRRLWQQLGDMLAHLHGAEPATLGLERGEPILTPAEELERWSATMLAAQLDGDERARRLAARLKWSPPTLRRPALLHGDFRLGNTLYDRAAVRAVIDWEIWSIGDARSDLGWLLLFTDHTNFPALGRAVPGTPTATDVVSGYERTCGSAIEGIGWFRALACFKLAAVQAHNLKRHREGRRTDQYLERFEPTIGRLLDVGLEQVEST